MHVSPDEIRLSFFNENFNMFYWDVKVMRTFLINKLYDDENRTVSFENWVSSLNCSWKSRSSTRSQCAGFETHHKISKYYFWVIQYLSFIKKTLVQKKVHCLLNSNIIEVLSKGSSFIKKTLVQKKVHCLLNSNIIEVLSKGSSY
jgi:hypothetical protein